MVYLSRYHLDAQISLEDFITDRVGPGWKVCRSTKQNRERYPNRITPGAYDKMKADWAERRESARRFLGWTRELDADGYPLDPPHTNPMGWT